MLRKKRRIIGRWETWQNIEASNCIKTKKYKINQRYGGDRNEMKGERGDENRWSSKRGKRI